MNQMDGKETQKTRDRYERISGVYDLIELLPEKMYQHWRERLWSMVQGPEVLEIGVGTGKNMSYYPEGIHITAIDLSPGMIEQAKKKKNELDVIVRLEVGDVQALDFPENRFDTAVATFVFCSVPDPVMGLQEIRRVVKPGGRVLLLEHVRAPNPILGSIMDIFNPVIKRIMGPNINRRTVETVRKARLNVQEVKNLDSFGIFKQIIAIVPLS